MPQFNWSLLAPIALAAAALAGGIAVLLSLLVAQPRSAARPLPSGPTPAAPTATATGFPSGPRLQGRVVGTPHLRSQPSSTAPILRDLQAGQLVEVSACNPACAWYQITLPGDAAPGWVSSDFLIVQGDTRGLPILR